MTSSLVGSEMCIRDRSLLIANFFKGSAQSHAESARCLFQAPHGFEKVPVSYTHLTLPTICSV
eukprot:8314166-Prorocentrum_lima.AAC.1